MRQGLIVVPALDRAMRLAHATDLELSLESGVSSKTVSKARSGKPIQTALANFLMEALCLRSFTYRKTGRPKKDK